MHTWYTSKSSPSLLQDKIGGRMWGLGKSAQLRVLLGTSTLNFSIVVDQRIVFDRLG